MARGSLTKSGNKWRGQVYLGKYPNGRDIRKSRTFDHPHTIAGRRSAEAEMDTWIETLRTWDMSGDTMSLDDLLDRYIDARVDVAGANPNTVATYRWSQQHVKTSGLGAKSINDVTVHDVEWLLSNLSTRTKDRKGLSKSSLERIRHHLRRAFKFARRNKWLTEDPMEFVEIPKQAANTNQRRSLMIDQAAAVLEASKGHRLEAAINVGMMRALRPGEVFGLRWQDLDLDSESPRLRVRHSRKHHKNEMWLGDLKTPKSERDLRLSPILVDLLAAEKVRQKAERKKAGKHWVLDHGDAVFTTRTGNLVNPSNVRRAVTALLAKAGIDEGFTPYEVFRHTGLSLLSAFGISDGDLIDLAGHVNEKMLYSSYRSAVTPTIDAGVDLISDRLRPSE